MEGSPRAGRVLPPLFAGRYEIEGVPVSDGARRVLRAVDRVTGQRVAIRGHLTGAGGPPGEGLTVGADAATEPFPADVVAELRLLRRAHHPRLPQPLGLGRAPWGDGQHLCFMVESWIDGQTLADVAGSLDGPALHHLAVELLRLVAHLHALGWVHLDLKPAHLIRSPSGWRLIDLDLAVPDRVLSRRGAFGTLPYLPPEVLFGQDSGVRSDLYGVGAVLWEAATGTPPPVEGRSLVEVGQAIARRGRMPVPERLRAAGGDLERLWMRLMAHRPEERPVDAEDALRLLGPEAAAWRREGFVPEVETVGWERVDAQVGELLSAASQGGGARVVGPPGSGRSRLMAELGERLGAQGWVVVDLPGGERSLESLAAGLRACLDRASEGVVEGGVRAGDAEEARRIDLVSLLLRGARGIGREVGRPVALLVDDAPALPPGELRALRLLVPYLKGSEVFLVVSGEESGLVGVDLPRVSLPMLDGPSLDTLARCLLGTERGPSPVEAEALLGATEGRPGWILEALGARWRDPSVRWESWAPRRGAELIRWNLAGLPVEAQALASHLSVLTAPFSPALAHVVAPVQSRDLLPSLVDAGLLRLLDTPAGPRYTFAAEALRRALHQALDPSERAALHLRVADHLDDPAGDAEGLGVRYIVDHLLAAGAEQRTIPFLEDAAQEHLQAGDHTRAADLLRVWIHLFHESSPARLTPMLLLAEIHHKRQENPAALALLEQILTHEDSLPHDERLRARIRLGSVLLEMSRVEEGLRLLEVAMPLANERGGSLDSAELARLWTRVAWGRLTSSRDLVAAEAALARAEALTRDEILRLEVGRLRCVAARVAGRPLGERITQLAALADDAVRLRYPAGEARLRSLLGQSYVEAGQLKEAEGQARRALEASRRAFDPAGEASAHKLLGNALREQHNPLQAVEEYAQTAALYQRDGNAAEELRARLEILELLTDVGNLARARREQQRIEEVRASGLPLPPIVALRAQVGEVALKRREGRLTGLRAEADGVYAALEALQPRNEQVADLMTYLDFERAHLAMDEGRIDEAAAIRGALKDEESAARSAPVARRINEASTQLDDRLADRGVDVVGIERSLRRGAATQAGGEGNDRTADRWFDHLARVLDLADEPERLLAALGDILSERLGGRGVIFIHLPGDQELVRRGDGVTAEQEMELRSDLIRQVVKTGRRLHVRDQGFESVTSSLRSFRTSPNRCLIIDPIKAPGSGEGEVLGAVALSYGLEPGADRQAVEQVRRVAELARRAVEILRRRRRPRFELPDGGEILGDSPAMITLLGRLREIGRLVTNQRKVLILGEMGTGKSLVARVLHAKYWSRGSETRGSAARPFKTVNAQAIPATLLQAELFGYKKGAYTGATRDHKGLLEQATGGTLFLDDAQYLPKDAQGMLITALEEKRARPLGGDEYYPLDFDLIVATNRNPIDLVRDGEMLPDFMRRIQVNPIYVPSLAQRGPEDIKALAGHFIGGILEAVEGGQHARKAIYVERWFTRDALSYLCGYSWPANVGQLRSVFEDARIQGKIHDGVTSGDVDRISREDLQEILSYWHGDGAPAPQPTGAHDLPAGLSLKELGREADLIVARYIKDVHRRADGNVSATAKELGCTRVAVYKYLELLEQVPEA